MKCIHCFGEKRIFIHMGAKKLHYLFLSLMLGMFVVVASQATHSTTKILGERGTFCNPSLYSTLIATSQGGIIIDQNVHLIHGNYLL